MNILGVSMKISLNLISFSWIPKWEKKKFLRE